jgi:hypothetical protein
VGFNNENNVTKDAKVFGYRSSVIYIALSIIFVILVVLSVTLSPPAEWYGKGGHLVSQYLYISTLGDALLAAPLVIVLFLSIYFLAPASKKYQCLLAVIFTSIFVVLVCANYYVQLTAVRENILSGDTSSVNMFIHQNTNSAMFAFDVLGYLFLGIASFLVAPVFNSNKLEKWIKALFNLYGIISIIGVIGHIVENQLVISFYGAVMSLILFILGLLLCKFFKS